MPLYLTDSPKTDLSLQYPGKILVSLLTLCNISFKKTTNANGIAINAIVLMIFLMAIINLDFGCFANLALFSIDWI